jgi:hypothetical protein
MDLPEGLFSGMGGSGVLNGVFPIFCTTCRATVAALAYEGPRFADPFMRRILIRFAQQSNIAALIELDQTEEISELWPEERVRASSIAWAELLSRHHCATE